MSGGTGRTPDAGRTSASRQTFVSGNTRPCDLQPVVEAGADLLVRVGWNSLRLLTPGGTASDLFAALA
ncbi:MAG: hypothetical protein ACRYGM_16900, partial [Janthinobacterium lividum]